MSKKQLDNKITEQLKQLEVKYGMTGQDLSSYLEGLLHADYLTYWDYIHLDTLLSLQTPKTSFKDEPIFIMYHQITELYLKLILWEMQQISEQVNPTQDFFITRLGRIVNYFNHLESSFSVMIDGMEREQFLKFRMSLLPASGFQSAQIRFIEIASTHLANLVHLDKRTSMKTASQKEMLENLYWKSGATELASGNKTLTLKQFEDKYADEFSQRAEFNIDHNLLSIYQKYFSNSPKATEIKILLREYDYVTNVSWRLAHYKSAVRYLHKDPEDIAATGGTNWQKYLPPRFQKVIFFPELWSNEEIEEWGKTWVRKEVFNQS